MPHSARAGSGRPLPFSALWGPGLLSSATMVNAGPPKPTGGDYGEVRASIDQVKLNAYLARSVPVVTVPVTVKQFKVRRLTRFATLHRTNLRLAVWPGQNQSRFPLHGLKTRINVLLGSRIQRIS